MDQRLLQALLAARQVGDDGMRWGPEGPEGYARSRPEVGGSPSPFAVDELGRRVLPETGLPPGATPRVSGSMDEWRERLLTLPTDPPRTYTPEPPADFRPTLPPDLQRTLLLEILRREGTGGATLR